MMGHEVRLSRRKRLTASFSDTQAERRAGRYRSRAAFKDRLMLVSDRIESLVPAGGRILDFGCGPGTIALARRRTVVSRTLVRTVCPA